MRIIAGRYRGRRLKAPTWEGLRPTSDKLRETLFNVLAPRIADARVVDAYAGTGAIGIEALSRGAASVVFIDADRRAQALVAANLSACGIEDGYTIERGDVTTVLRHLPDDPRFDIIVLDPPYDADGVTDVLNAAAGRIAASGVIVLERATRREPIIPPALVRARDVVSGDSTLTLLQPAGGRALEDS